jgi:hypothetical protein
VRPAAQRVALPDQIACPVSQHDRLGRIYQLGGHAMTSPDPGSDTKTMKREFGVRTPSKFSFPQEAEQINGVA